MHYCYKIPNEKLAQTITAYQIHILLLKECTSSKKCNEIINNIKYPNFRTTVYDTEIGYVLEWKFSIKLVMNNFSPAGAPM